MHGGSIVPVKTITARTQEQCQFSIEQALLDIWREYGMSIEKLGRLERIEYHAVSAVYDILR